MKNRSTWKAVGLVALWLALLVLPSLARAAYYYRGWYRPGSIDKPGYAVDDLSPLEMAAFVETDLPRAEGIVVVDQAHGNTFQQVELNVLLSRLTARGVKNVPLKKGDNLSSALYNALALIVVSPHTAFTPAEIKAVQQFVEQGGRVLLIADPSRYAWTVRYDDMWGEYEEIESDVPAINSLAAPFGLAYSDDYVYNTVKNGGHYQYVILDKFAENALTAQLNQVVMYAAHSLASTGEVLIAGDADTTSSLSEQAGGLALMGLGGGGNVLAIPDLTFMTEPYNSAADNNRLISNIADFLAGATRLFGLTDFPHFFGDEVGIVPLIDIQDPQAITAQALGQLADIKSAFEATGRVGQLWADTPDMDVIYIGLYGSVEFWPDVAEILAGEGISFTLETVDLARATPTPTPRFTPTPTPTRAKDAPPLPPTSTPVPLKDWIRFADAGPVEAKDVALFYQNEQGSRQVMIVLAYTQAGLRGAAKRLIDNDFDGCLMQEDRRGDPEQASIILCPTSYDAAEFESTPAPTPTTGGKTTPEAEETPTVTPTPEPVEGSILIVSDDNGEIVYEGWTSAYAFDGSAQSLGYQTIFWSTNYDGRVTLEMMWEHDAVIWCTGDYQDDLLTPDETDLMNLIEYMIDGGRMILSGAFIGSPEDSEAGLLIDIQVAQDDHPLAFGFKSGEVIALERFTSDEDYAPFVLDEDDSDMVIFVRGPNSAFAGRPLISVEEGTYEEGRTMVIAFPIYLLPYDAQSQLARNAITWLMASE